jgi:lipopolysaccharide transport system permease protein
MASAQQFPQQIASATASATCFRIQPMRGWTSLDLIELWEYRELLYFLTWRDIKVRYKMAALGAAWAILQPVLTMLVFTLFFGRLARVPSDGVPYSLFSLSALIPWTFFATGLTQAANSVVGSSNLITKVYFPRLTIPTAAVLAGLVDLALSCSVLVLLMVIYHRVPTGNVIWVPVLLLLALIAALGVGFWLSALNVDIRYVVPFLVQLWLFATPIAYPSSLLSPRWRLLYGLNPMVGVVEGIRWALFGTKTTPDLTVACSAVASLVILVAGAFYFRRVERRFADVI